MSVSRTPTLSDGAIALRALSADELPAALALSAAADAREFVIVGTLEGFRTDFHNPSFRFLGIVECAGDTRALAGYFILVLEPDGISVECRRIVVGRKDRGIGKRAMALLDRYCREVLDRRRIWLDVYDFNGRGRRVYESTGYRFTGEARRDGRTLRFYEKRL